jgi:hypothetical protein
MLELWVDSLPQDSAEINTDTCQDFLRLIEKQSVILCTEKTNTEWNALVGKWQTVFDKTLGIGKFEACRTYWLMPRSKQKIPGDYDAHTFLTETPDQLLRIALERKQEPVVTNAMEFVNQFGMFTSGSKQITVFDRYLLSIQEQLMHLTENGIEHQTNFQQKHFNRQIHSLNLILRSLPESVVEIKIYSDMLSWRIFRNVALLKGIETSKEEYYTWANNSFEARQAAMKCIFEGLVRQNIPTTITFIDCFQPNSQYTNMEHDRFVNYSQNRSFISSGGFNNVWSAVSDDGLEKTDLHPKTFMIQVPDTAPTPPNLRMIHKDCIVTN